MSVPKTAAPPLANQQLIINLLLHLGEPYAFLGEQLRANPYSENWRKAQRELLEAFPFMVSNQLRDLFTPDSCEHPNQRLSDLTACAHTVLRLVSGILLSDSWQQAEQGQLLLTESEKAAIQTFFTAPAPCPDFQQLFTQIDAAFQRERLDFFLPALRQFLTNAKAQSATQYFQAMHPLEPATFARADHLEAEAQLTELLLASDFLVRNELTVVKQVATDWTRDFDQPSYVQHQARLRGQDYHTGGVAKISQATANYSRSVLLVRGGEAGGLLNLSPFLVDQNSYKVKSYHLPKVYFLIKATSDGLTFQHSDTDDLFFALQRAEAAKGFLATERLFTAWDQFCDALELTY
ncbi:MAG: hypothetical protein AAGJ82_02650 [Bacteroidota bacterium]